jgi:hypothetical protein
LWHTVRATRAPRAAIVRAMSGVRRFTHLLCGQIHVRAPGWGDDEAIAALAGAQSGVVARWQLLALGVTGRAIDYRLAVGRLRRVHPGVYAVGHESLTLTARATAATLATAPEVAASHWTTLALHGLIDRPRPLIHVTCPHPRRPRRGLFIHRAVLPPDEVETVAGIPTTVLARTFLDLSAEGDERGLRTFIKRAEYRRLLAADDIAAILERYPWRRGRRTLARIAKGYALSAGPTLRPLEDDFLECCGRRGIPLPETNVPIQAGGRVRIVDGVWREARLVVELDGREAHVREVAFEEDRRRDRALTAAGWRVVRVTHGQLRGAPEALEADLRALLGLDAR